MVPDSGSKSERTPRQSDVWRYVSISAAHFGVWSLEQTVPLANRAQANVNFAMWGTT